MARTLSSNNGVPVNGNHAGIRSRAALEERAALPPKKAAEPLINDEAWGDDGEPAGQPAERQPEDSGNLPSTEILVDEQEYERLRVEIDQLRTQLAAAQAGDPAADWAERQKDYEALLEEKSEVIRELHQTIAELEDRPTAPAANVPREEELLALSEDLERERRQLKEDEESLMQQMRDMEVQMSKERAELARQRAEMQRLNTEFRHEMELASRDSALRERLAPLQRKHTEMISRKGGAPSTMIKPPAPEILETPPPVPAKSRKDSGLIRRLFGSA